MCRGAWNIQKTKVMQNTEQIYAVKYIILVMEKKSTTFTFKIHYHNTKQSIKAFNGKDARVVVRIDL